jgi:hypothetical protein
VTIEEWPHGNNLATKGSDMEENSGNAKKYKSINNKLLSNIMTVIRPLGAGS